MAQMDLRFKLNRLKTLTHTYTNEVFDEVLIVNVLCVSANSIAVCGHWPDDSIAK